MNNTRKPISAVALLVALLLLSSHRGQASADEEVEDETEFSYIEGSCNGPERWGYLNENWTMCRDGKMQSPIDLWDARPNPFLDGLYMNYRIANATIENRGHDIMIEWGNGTAGSINIMRKTYFLRQLHWHSPAEHSIKGWRPALELHMVHVSADGEIAVIGILYEYGRSDDFLTTMHEHIEDITGTTLKKKDIGKVDPRWVHLNSYEPYYRYDGSLTTPPCSEGVLWTVLREVRTVGRYQVDWLRNAVNDDARMNARPIQPRNGRPVYKSVRSSYGAMSASA
ncbi:Bifunctional monodehydroascorbate reductase and carbonic anhydrase nectarin-3 [Acorus gramineus]|uniref:Bifunctional monodehydroascorbate reductase and carbonic anhydrase nectarin-3 n=1 Tax=Acorus gramineus TaxID=55184 RepID=A0AAV9AQP6_ACOGR|nr:Bifunctional monodehydroascorbate reductase and carbonic anhydrase nectarin-3 [Acorus gramineus]